MGKKKITKAPKTPKAQEEADPASDRERSEEPQPEPEAPKSKKVAKGKKDAPKLNLFSDSFNNKVDRFKTFYEDFLVIRGGNSDADDELSQVTNRVAGKLESACSDVLKNDLKDAESWITDRQKEFMEQISSTQTAIQTTKSALERAGTFSSEEIDKQIAGISEKEKLLKQRMEDFEALKARAVKIYTAEAAMDEE